MISLVDASGPDVRGECVSISCRNRETGGNDGEGKKTTKYYDDNENSGCSYALVRTPVSFFLYRLLTQFLAFPRPFLSSPFILPRTRDSCGPRLRLDLFFCRFSSSSVAATAGPLRPLLLLPPLETTYKLVAFQSPKSGRTSSRQAGLSRTRDLALSACTFLNDVPHADSARV